MGSGGGNHMRRGETDRILLITMTISCEKGMKMISKGMIWGKIRSWGDLKLRRQLRDSNRRRTLDRIPLEGVGRTTVVHLEKDRRSLPGSSSWL